MQCRAVKRSPPKTRTLDTRRVRKLCVIGKIQSNRKARRKTENVHSITNNILYVFLYCLYMYSFVVLLSIFLFLSICLCDTGVCYFLLAFLYTGFPTTTQLAHIDFWKRTSDYLVYPIMF